VFGKHVFRPILVVYPKKMSFCQKYKKYFFFLHMAKNPKNNIGACLKIKKKLQKKNSFAC
jgi:hypothetical protein